MAQLRRGVRPVNAANVSDRDAFVKALQKRSATRQSTLTAPALVVLEQTTRPVHGVMAGARAAIKGKNVPKAVGRGVALKDKSLGSDLLKDLGVKNKTVAGVGGFLLDVGADPATYLTLGASAPAKAAGREAARKAQRTAARSVAAQRAAQAAAAAATKRGTTSKAAEQAGRRAAKTHARRQGQKAAQRAAQGKATNNGLDIRFAGRSVPGIVRATSAAKRAPRAVAARTGADRTRIGRKVDNAQRRVRDAARASASEFNPNITPVGVDRESYQAMRRAARTARARTQRGSVYAGLRANSYKRVGEENYAKVIDAIETGTVKALPGPLRQEARRLEQEFARMRKREVRAGIKVGDATKKPGIAGYVKHLRLKNDPPRPSSGGVGRRKVAPDFGKSRTEGTLREKNLAEPGAYSEDIPQIYGQRAGQSARAVAQARMNAALRAAGRRPRAGEVDALADGEAVFRIKGSDLQKITKQSHPDVWRRARVGRAPGNVVILNENALKRTAGTVGGASDRTVPGLAFDKVQGVWKMGATVINPGYYVRNVVGEGTNAYLKENPLRLARNAGTAARSLRELKRREEAARRGVKPERGPHAEMIDAAEDVGAVRAGQFARELGDLVESRKPGKLRGRNRLGRVGRVASRSRDNVEDVFRLASFKGGLDRGLKPEVAMQRASQTHFDYGDLTPTERKAMRRVMPFYTFSSRNIPLQVKSLVQRPGKFAQYQKVREEVAKAFGLEPGYEENWENTEKRAAAVGIVHKGVEISLSLGPTGLPLTDLNEVPMVGLLEGKSPDQAAKETANEWLERAASMLTPFLKTPAEIGFNFSYFFRDQIERDDSPLVPAPSWVSKIPKAYRDEMKIVPDFDNKNAGKKTWGWSAKTDYIVNQFLVGPAGFVNRATKEDARPGQGTSGKTLQYLGLRVRPVDAAKVRTTRLYDERERIMKDQAALRQRGAKAGQLGTVPAKLRQQYIDNAQALRKIEREIAILRAKQPGGRLSKTPAKSGGGVSQQELQLLMGG